MTGSPPIKLVVKGLGDVPSFKNSKMIARGRLITDPEKQRWMERCTKAFESQLRSWCQTAGIVISTEQPALSRIASSMPLDDCLHWIPKVSVSWRGVSKGEEGAVVSIEPIH